ncbi:MAG TPA: NAD-dependent epimerase/dehydratase family protein [Gammaproteobacteria bacterium]|nr:NAD-dependent epimerase/dehydratase family protein [Gammaproteobacteria bacterium]
MITAWVIGGNGLLGSALQRVLRRRGIRVFEPDERFCWESEGVIAQLEAAVKAFSAFVGSGNRWQIYWAAGVGTMSSTEVELNTETRTLSAVLDFITTEQDLAMESGGVAFASSAGAIYAGSTEDIITENTPVAPTTDYANEKLRQEDLLDTFVKNKGKVSVLCARISTLYGPGQATGKRQGLLAHIARCIIRNQAVHIYVPLDTIRDYIAADDAATMIVVALCTLKEKPGVFTKIIASEKPTTIAEIVSVYKRVARRSPKIVASASKLSTLYTRRIQFCSSSVPIIESCSKTSLLVGVAQVLAAERASFTRSTL